MKIQWKSKVFWLTLVPAILLLVQIILSWFHINFAADLIGQEASKCINAFFALLAIIGVVNDPPVQKKGNE